MLNEWHIQLITTLLLISRSYKCGEVIQRSEV